MVLPWGCRFMGSPTASADWSAASANSSAAAMAGHISSGSRGRIVGRSAADIYQKLLHQGVIVRPMTPFGLETALRITVGTPEENRKLVKALRTVLGKPAA